MHRLLVTEGSVGLLIGMSWTVLNVSKLQRKSVEVLSYITHIVLYYEVRLSFPRDCTTSPNRVRVHTAVKYFIVPF
jgi:hypothetical protein